jgi:hypothetical protein
VGRPYRHPGISGRSSEGAPRQRARHSITQRVQLPASLNAAIRAKDRTRPTEHRCFGSLSIGRVCPSVGPAMSYDGRCAKAAILGATSGI